MALGGQLLAQQDQAQDLAGGEGVTGGGEEQAVVESPAGPSASSPWQITEKASDSDMLGPRDAYKSITPALYGGPMNIELALDAALADEFDEASEVTAGPFVDLKHGAPGPWLAPAQR